MRTHKKELIKSSASRAPLGERERTIIELRFRAGISVRAIAREIDRNASTVSREIAGKPQNGRGRYSAVRNHYQATLRIKQRGNTTRCERHTALRKYVIQKLKLGWSPEQISLRLPVAYPTDPTMRLSHEAIYQYVYAQIHRRGYGAVKPGCEDLRSYLPRRRKRRMRKGFRKAQKAARHASLPSIENRPCVVAKRSRIGDWEDDTLLSRGGQSRIKSINERRSGVFFFGKTKDGTARSCDSVVRRRLGTIPEHYRKTLTRDRGSENREHQSLAADLKLAVFFAHPYSSHERGSNENGNGLLRRYFPKGTNWDTVSEQEIAQAEFLINSRPRKRHNGLTPLEVFYQETGVAINY